MKKSQEIRNKQKKAGFWDKDRYINIFWQWKSILREILRRFYVFGIFKNFFRFNTFKIRFEVNANFLQKSVFRRPARVNLKKKKLKNIFSRIKSKKTSVHRLGAIFQSGNNGQSSIHVWYWIYLCIFQKSYAYFVGILTKSQKRGDQFFFGIHTNGHTQTKFHF